MIWWYGAVYIFANVAKKCEQRCACSLLILFKRDFISRVSKHIYVWPCSGYKSEQRNKLKQNLLMKPFTNFLKQKIC